MVDENVNLGFPAGFDPEADAPDPDRVVSGLETQPISWHVDPEAIRSMSHEELLQEVLLMGERVRRLYEVAMLPVHIKAPEQAIKPEDIENILHPIQDEPEGASAE